MWKKLPIPPYWNNLIQLDFNMDVWKDKWNQNTRVRLPSGVRPRLKYIITDKQAIEQWLRGIENPLEKPRYGRDKSERFVISWLGLIPALDLWYQIDRPFVKHVKHCHKEIWQSRNQVSWLIEHPIAITYSVVESKEGDFAEYYNYAVVYKIVSIWNGRLVCVIYSLIGHRIVTMYPVMRPFIQNEGLIWRDEEQIAKVDDIVQYDVEHELLAQALTEEVVSHIPRSYMRYSLSETRFWELMNDYNMYKEDS